MQAFFNKVTKDSDLHLRKEVLVASVHGNLNFGFDTNFKIVKITSFEILDEIQMYTCNNGGQYMANEMILFENNVNIVGYQIESNDGLHEIPESFHSFEVFTTLELAEFWLLTEKASPENGEFRWVTVPIYDGDIEEPTFLEYI